MSTPARHGHLEIDAATGLGVVVVEMTSPAPRETVWAAVSTRDGLAAWAGEVEGELRSGGAYTAHLFPSGWEGAGRVLECEPGRRWRVEGAEEGQPAHVNELTLAPAAGGDLTVITLTERGVPREMLHFYGVGVQLHLENLVAHLGGRPLVDPEAFWAGLLPEYERLAAELP
ncbi:SRPBCC domain-containing protein [Frondihabitans australicus]|uniref:Uncharacterized protein YndB with AHSA1/START domain n=1 Tax=Frondihabitans australicus TaxID=386892 RepID=A0A495IEL1_9MICO|nr:SRPBCC domain-containing protein [Frondihabitans australicus]RKR74422.1 uncharacterized protein YndB with AHSA1/START domain [Frondihabitans australicus]